MREYDCIIDSIQKLWSEVLTKKLDHSSISLDGVLFFKDQMTSYIRSHDDDCVGKVYGPSLTIRGPSVIQNL